MRDGAWPGRTTVLAALILVALTLGGCGSVPTRGVAVSTSTTVTPLPVPTRISLRTPVASQTASAAVTPRPPIVTPSGDPYEGVVTRVYRNLTPLKKLINGSEPTSPKGHAPYGFALATYAPPDEWGDVDITTMLNDGARIAKEQDGRLVAASPYDLARGQKVAFWGVVAESYPGQGQADFVLIKDEGPVDLTPPQRPKAIYSLGPNEEGEMCPQTALSVELLLNNAMREEGFVDMSKIKLEIDGKDVTGEAEVLGTADRPQSMLRLLYKERLDLGHHEAVLTYRDKDGEVRTYQWEFSVVREIELGGATAPC